MVLRLGGVRSAALRFEERWIERIETMRMDDYLTVDGKIVSVD